MRAIVGLAGLGLAAFALSESAKLWGRGRPWFAVLVGAGGVTVGGSVAIAALGPAGLSSSSSSSAATTHAPVVP